MIVLIYLWCTLLLGCHKTILFFETLWNFFFTFFKKFTFSHKLLSISKKVMPKGSPPTMICAFGIP